MHPRRTATIATGRADCRPPNSAAANCQLGDVTRAGNRNTCTATAHAGNGCLTGREIKSRGCAGFAASRQSRTSAGVALDKKNQQKPPRTGGRAVDCTGLENQQRRKSLGGSNPPPSAISVQNWARQFPPISRLRWRQACAKLVFRSLDEHLALCDLDALGEGAQVITAVAATRLRERRPQQN